MIETLLIIMLVVMCIADASGICRDHSAYPCWLIDKLPELYVREESRSAESIGGDGLDVDVLVGHGTPELEQDKAARSV